MASTGQNALKLKCWAGEVKSEDHENHEAIATAHYFRNLFTELEPFYWQNKNQVQTLEYYRSNVIEKRAMEDVAPEEIWIAIREVLEHNISSDEDELVRYLARLYGFAKTGRQIDSHLRLVNDVAITEKLLVRENEKVRLIC